jgi:hypothetical protein
MWEDTRTLCQASKGGGPETLQLNEIRSVALALELKLEEIETQRDAKGLGISCKTAKEKQAGAITTMADRPFFSPNESGSSSLRVKVAPTISDGAYRVADNVGNTTAAPKKSRHFFRVEISGPFCNKTSCASESLQAAEEERTRGTVRQRYAYRPARRQDQFSTERDDLCRNLCNEQRCRMSP